LSSINSPSREFPGLAVGRGNPHPCHTPRKKASHDDWLFGFSASSLEGFFNAFKKSSFVMTPLFFFFSHCETLKIEQSLDCLHLLFYQHKEVYKIS
jgi:hypothetical protein